MPRYTEVKGPSAELLVERFEPVIAAADALRVQLLAHNLVLERARGAGLARERERVIDKHGADSPQAARAIARVEAQARATDALATEHVRSQVGATRLEADAAVIHGRVVDAAGAAREGAIATLVDAQGKAVAQARLDARGYYRLAAPAAAGTRLVITDAHGAELVRDEVDGVTDGQALYREHVAG